MKKVVIFLAILFLLNGCDQSKPLTLEFVRRQPDIVLGDSWYNYQIQEEGGVYRDVNTGKEYLVNTNRHWGQTIYIMTSECKELK